MIPVSDRFLRAAQSSHRPVARAYLSQFGRPGMVEVPVYSGSVKISNRSDVTRTLEDMVVGISGMTPLSSTSALNVYGSQVQVHRGFRYLDGSEELVPVGTFLVEDIQETSSPQEQASISGRDLSAIISYNRWEDLYPMAGKKVPLAIRDAIENRAPGRFKFNLADSSQVVQSWTLGEERENDPWADFVSLAKSYGMLLSMDPYGNVVLREAPVRFSTKGASFEFVDHHNLVSHSYRRKTDGLYNRVVVVGEPPEGAPVRGVAEDGDQASPTYVGGPFGVRQRFYTSSLIYSEQQANHTAETLLMDAMSSEHIVEFRGFVNPALAEGDVVRLGAPISSQLPSELFELDEITIPLTGELSTDYVGRCLKTGIPS